MFLKDASILNIICDLILWAALAVILTWGHASYVWAG